MDQVKCKPLYVFGDTEQVNGLKPHPGSLRVSPEALSLEDAQELRGGKFGNKEAS